MVVFEHSINVLEGGQSSTVAISTTSAQSVTFDFPNMPQGYVLITSDAPCFLRQGVNPTAVSNGTDQYIVANKPYRAFVNSGNKLAFITASGTGNVYLTPGG